MAEADPQFAGAQAVTSEPPSIEDAEATTASRTRRRWLRPLLFAVVPMVLLAIAGYWWLTSGTSASTDNATVGQDKVSVSSDVAGRIVAVNVRENQHVNAGDVLFRIDPEPYRIALAQANAAIANAQVGVGELQAEYQGKSADIQAAEDAILSAQQDYQRQSELMTRGFTTRARLEQSQHQLAQARAQLGNAQAAAVQARARLATGSAVPGENPAIAAAMVQRQQAMLNLARTEVRAPISGTISQTGRLQIGSQLITGLPAVTIVASSRSWVVANFKETDLNRMRVGQPAEVSLDAYPGLHLRGHIQSIGAGTGSEFSVLPAQNATGNWVKVTQRIPVRIAIDEASPRQLIAGQSADVTVRFDGQR